jgi:cytochrome c oxidase subunit 2
MLSWSRLASTKTLFLVSLRDTWFKKKSGISMDSAPNCAEKNTRTRSMSGFVCRRLSRVGGCKAKEAATKADDPAKVWEQFDLKVRGEKVYAANCVACHQATGKGVE